MARAARAGVAVGLAIGSVVALTVVALPRAHADDAEAVLERARTATVREEFSGLVQIEWLAGGEWQTARVPVSGTGGTVQVGEGTRKAEGRGSDRWIAGVSGWQAGWGEPVTGRVPRPSAHWRLEVQRGPEVAGRTTDVVVASDPATKRVRLRVYVDRDTGILLRREVLDTRARVVRAVGFVEVKKLGGPRSLPPTTPAAKGGAPVEVVRLPEGFHAPAKVAASYELVGRYLRDDGTVQLYYTDGLFGVSVFQQRGNLNWNGLPSGGAGLEVDGAPGRSYQAAGGTVVVWARGGVTRTVVSDATVDDLQAFAAAFDARATERGDGLLERVAGFVLGPFGWR